MLTSISQADLVFWAARDHKNRWRAAEVQHFTGVRACVCSSVISVVLRSRSGVFDRTPTPTPTRSGRQARSHARTGWCRHSLCVRHHTKSFPVLLHVSDWNTVTNCWHSSSYNQPCIHCPAACIQTQHKGGFALYLIFFVTSHSSDILKWEIKNPWYNSYSQRIVMLWQPD